MKDILVLTKVLLKNIFQVNSNSESRKGFLKFLLYSFVFIYIAGILGFMSYNAINSLMEMNQEAVFVSIGLATIAGFIIFQTIFTSLNVLFFSKDIEFLLPLPVKPIKIVMAKFNVLLLSEYIMELIIGLIPLSIYGYLIGAGYTYYLLIIGILLLFPILPVLVSASIIIILMRFTNLIKNKDVVQYITVGLTLTLAIAAQFLTGYGSPQITNVELAEKLMEANSFVSTYTKYFITLEPTMNAIINYNTIEGLKNFLILFAETIVGYLIVMFIASKLYLQTVVKGASGGTKNRRKINDKSYKGNNVLISYIEKEFKILVKNPIFFMQCVTPSILFPIIFSVPLFSVRNELLPLVGILNTSFGLAVAIAALEFFFMFNYIALTAISRDGQNAIFMKYIPVSLYSQCIYKILPGILLNLIPIVYVITVIKLVLPTVNIIMLFYLVVTSILLNVLGNMLMILVDLKRPKLTWTSEYAVTKQNMNMIFEMLFGLLLIGGVMLLTKFVENINLLAIIITMVLALGVYLTNKYLYKNQNTLFKKII